MAHVCPRAALRAQDLSVPSGRVIQQQPHVTCTVSSLQEQSAIPAPPGQAVLPQKGETSQGTSSVSSPSISHRVSCWVLRWADGRTDRWVMGGDKRKDTLS